MLLLISKVKKLLEHYYAKDQPKNQDCKSYQKKIQCTLRQMDVYDNSFNSQIDIK